MTQTECTNGSLVEVSQAESLRDCLDQCVKSKESCSYVTFYDDARKKENNRRCLMFSDCTLSGPCTQCKSAKTDCTLNYECEVKGKQCDGTFIGSLIEESMQLCLRSCQGDPDCQYVTYYNGLNVCTMYSDCQAYIKEKKHKNARTSHKYCSLHAGAANVFGMI